MKKFNAKFIVSALIAASMISASAVAASASDYNTPKPVMPATTTSSSTNTDTSSGSDTSGTGTSADSPATVLTDDTIKELLKSGKDEVFMVEDSKGNVTVSEAAIGEIAKSDKPITINIESKDGVDCSITIDPKSIKEVKAINLAMNISAPTSDKTVDGVKVPAGSVIIDPVQKGDFGMTLKINVGASAFKGIDLASANVFYLHDGNIKQLPDGTFVANKDGSGSISISSASAYVITDEDLLGDSGEINIDETDNGDNGTNKGNDTTTTVVDGGNDSNPVTGTTLALGSLAVFAAAAAITSKKRK